MRKANTKKAPAEKARTTLQSFFSFGWSGFAFSGDVVFHFCILVLDYSLLYPISKPLCANGATAIG